MGGNLIQKGRKIGILSAIPLLMAAGFWDLVQLGLTVLCTFVIPIIGFAVAWIINTYISICVSIIIGLWLAEYGAGPFSDTKSTIRFLITLLGEILPFSDNGPWWLVSTWIAIVAHNRSLKKDGLVVNTTRRPLSGMRPIGSARVFNERIYNVSHNGVHVGSYYSGGRGRETALRDAQKAGASERDTKTLGLLMSASPQETLKMQRSMRQASR